MFVDISLIKKSIKEFKRMLLYMKTRIKVYLIGLLGMSAASACLSIITAFAMKYMMDASTSKNAELLTKSLILIGIGVGIVVLASPIFYYILRSSIIKTIAHIREMAIQHIQRLPVNYMEQKHSGDTISRVTSDINTMQSAYAENIQNVITAIFLGIGSAIFMLVLDWRISLIFIGTAAAISLISMRFAGPIRKLSDKIQTHMSGMNERFTDILGGYYVMKMFHLEDKLKKDFEKENENVKSFSVKRVKKAAMLNSTNYLLSMFNFVGIMAIGVILVMKNITGFGTLIALIQFQTNVTNTFLEMGKLVSALQSSLAGAQRVFELLDQPLEPERLGDDSKTTCSSMLEMENVIFSYNDGKNVLNGLTIKVMQGQTVALVGDSGSGKSTAMKLFMGFYPVQKGLIAIAGKSLGYYDVKKLRDLIAYVSQDCYLFSGTIEENIGYGNPGASKDEIIKAAQAADAHEFITQMSGGYSTLVGERGARLSGGERQRIAIARAFLRNAPILLLDEATSALDSETEHQVQKALNSLMQDRTVLAIAHRLSTIENADVVYAFKDGRVVESGKHKELIEMNGLYNKLYRMQFSDEKAV